jgi:ribosome-binding factor A
VLRATSVVEVTVSPDLRAATATVTTRGDAAAKREAYSWLVANATGFRYALAQRLRNSKRVPEITFRKADVGSAVALMRLIEKVAEDDEDEDIEGGLDFGLDLDEVAEDDAEDQEIEGDLDFGLDLDEVAEDDAEASTLAA